MINNKLISYKTLPKWHASTLPQAFRQKHNTQEGTWAKLEIKTGHLDFEVMDESGNIISSHQFSKENQPPLIEPQVWHRISDVSDDLICQLSFYCTKKDYPYKKYGLSPTHSEVVEMLENVQIDNPNDYKVLDLGSASGRNSLYLALHGFNVTAKDISNSKINTLQHIIQEEQLDNLTAKVYDINNAKLAGKYDFIISTVVLMFLDSEKMPLIIKNMQDSTQPNGYNLIVSVMDTEDYPCELGIFSHKFKENELKDYYQDWEIIKYNENPGKLHKLDPNGSRYEFRFTTLLAKKN